MAKRSQPGRQRILDAYVELLSERGKQDFPIKLLVSRAQVNRATFYNHFTGLDDVADKLIDQFFEAYRASFTAFHVPGGDVPHAEQSSSAVLGISFVAEHQDEFRALLASDRSAEFKQRWIDAIEGEYLLYEFTWYEGDDPADLTPEEVGFHLHALAYCTVAFMERWCEGGFRQTPEELVALMMRCMGLSTDKGEMRYVGLRQ